MKKLLTAIFIVNILAVPCFAISKNASTEEKLEYIKEQSIKMKTKRMERTWENLCEQDPKTCKEKQGFEPLFYDKTGDSNMTVTEGQGDASVFSV